METASYWEQIEQYFVAKRGSALILSPKDWPLVSSWEERGVPLEAVFEGIDLAYQRHQDKCAAGQRQAHWTLTACQHDVERAWNAWRDQHPEMETPDEQDALESERRKISSKLHSLAARLQTHAADGHYAFVREAILATIRTLSDLRKSLDDAKDDEAIATIKAAIHQAEHTLTTHLEYAIPDAVRANLLANAEARLASHKSQMSEHIYQETLNLAFLQELHRLYPFPPFL